MAGTTYSASLNIIISSIRGKSFKYLVQKGVMKTLVKMVGEGQKGNRFSEPFWDPTGVAATALTEGADFTGKQSYVNATASFTAAESGVYTYITDDVLEGSRPQDDVVEEHARAHGIAHAKRLEQNLVAKFSSFTGGSLTATGTYGLNLIHVSKAKTLLQGTEYDPGDDMSLVMHPFAWQNLLSNTTNASNIGTIGDVGNAIQAKYALGKLYGDVSVYFSNYIPLTATSTTRRWAGLFVRDAIGLWVPRDYRLEDQRFITERATKLVSTMRYGSAARITKFGVKIATLAGTPS